MYVLFFFSNQILAIRRQAVHCFAYTYTERTVAGILYIEATSLSEREREIGSCGISPMCIPRICGILFLSLLVRELNFPLDSVCDGRNGNQMHERPQRNTE